MNFWEASKNNFWASTSYLAKACLIEDQGQTDLFPLQPAISHFLKAIVLYISTLIMLSNMQNVSLQLVTQQCCIEDVYILD